MIPIDVKRLNFAADLRPALGSTFQPTGFPDIGAAVFDRIDPDGSVSKSLLVESVQSMANRLEATAWDAANDRPVALLDGLPYVRVVRRGTGEVLTSSRQEAHRLASAYVRESRLDGRDMLEVIGERLGLAKDTPLNYPRMAAALLAMDPFCLIHGVFFSDKKWLGQPKFARAVSAVIEAYDVREAISGGRKSDRVRLQLDKDREGGGTSEGYGSVPFPRVEYTARQIHAAFRVDVELLASCGLGDAATELLVGIALWEIATLLSGGLRLRTACDLEVVGEVGGDVPLEAAALAARITELIGQCGDALGGGEPITVDWPITMDRKG